MDLFKLFRDCVSQYLGLGVKVAGAAALGPLWPLVEPAVGAVMRAAGADVERGLTTPDERMAKVVEQFERDEQLQGLFESVLQQQLGPELQRLLRNQEETLTEVSESTWQLAAMISKNRIAVSEEVHRVRSKLDEGVPVAELSRHALEQMAQVVQQQLEESNMAREIGREQQVRLLSEARSQVQRLQLRATFSSGDGPEERQEAWNDLRAASLILSMLLQQAPNDVQLRLLAAMGYKGMAQIAEAEGEDEQAEYAIDKAEELFGLIKNLPTGQKSVLDLANAVHGLGNVQSLRRQHDRALESYRRALEYEPDHVWALHDIFVVLKNKADAGEVDLTSMERALNDLTAALARLQADGQTFDNLSPEYIRSLRNVLDRYRQ